MFPLDPERRRFLQGALALAASPALLAGCGSSRIRRFESLRPGALPAHLRIADFYAQAYLFGPPVSEKLLAFVENLYTAEEAEVVQHLPLIHGMTAQTVARKLARPQDEVERILTRLADEKRAILAFQEREFKAILSGSPLPAVPAGAGETRPRKFGLMPLLPGTFDLPLVEGKTDPWHRSHGRLFEAVYQTGYLAAALRKPMPVTRFLLVEKSIEAVPAALPANSLSELLDQHRSFALGFCQCRQARAFSGHDCALPLETCMAAGVWADYLASRGMMRRVERAEALEVKLRANDAGLVTMTLNVDSRQPGILCSCCGCCCVVLRTLSQFNAPGLIAQPRFLPARETSRCVSCGACQVRCPVQAQVRKETGWEFRRERCIGCGVCASVCPRKAITLEAMPNGPRPPANYARLALRLAPAYLRNTASLMSR